MYLVEKFANSIGEKASLSLGLDDNKKNIVIYGAINLMQTILSIIWVAVVGYVFGALYEAILFSVTVSVLRKYSGGIHASSPNRCIFIGTFVAVGTGILINKLFCNVNISIILVISIICLVVSSFVIRKNAPVDSVSKPITDIRIRYKFKTYSTIIIVIYSVIVITLLLLIFISKLNLFYIRTVECLSLGSLWQSITLTKLGINILSKVDLALKNII